ncbi:Ycf66 family protein [Synechocystis sp. LKSZ1]|uniref:Ycf66 family protein n=1 Tax=Synechocystis sp. LKSZ1 TaxID=3144951 RepID=UPI00336BF454
MLAVILALTVGLASLVFFFSAFFAPKLHRKDDFLWSGVGFFYALVLWICSQRLTGGVLLGQGAATVLILSFAWQTLKLRAIIANAENLPEFKSFSLLDWLSGGRRKPKTVKPQPPQAPTEPTEPELESATEPEAMVKTEQPAEVIAETVEEVLEVVEDIVEVSTTSLEPETISESLPETTSDTGETPVSPSMEPELIESAGPDQAIETAPKTSPPLTTPSPSAKPSKPGFFSRLFGRRSTPPPTIREALDSVAQEEIDDELDELDELDDLELAVEESPQETNEDSPEMPVVTEVEGETVAPVETINEDLSVPVETEESVTAELTETIDNADNTEMSEPVEAMATTPVVSLEAEESLGLGAEDNDDNPAVREPMDVEPVEETSLLDDLDDLLDDDDIVSPELETVLERPVDDAVTASSENASDASDPGDAEPSNSEPTDTAL